MRQMNKYEEIVADYVHAVMKKHEDWPYNDSTEYMNQLQHNEPLTGKEFVCVWLKDGEAFTKECNSPIEFVDVPHDCETIFRHQIEEAFYDATRPYQEIYC